MSNITGKIVGVLIMAAILIISSLYVITYISNNIICSKFSKQLTNLDLPSGTSIVETKQIVGKLVGNGNSIDFLACVLVKSDLSQEDLAEILDNATFYRAKSDDECKEKEVVRVEGVDLESKYAVNEIVIFDSMEEVADRHGFYALILFDGGYSADFDLRGH